MSTRRWPGSTHSERAPGRGDICVFASSRAELRPWRQPGLRVSSRAGGALLSGRYGALGGARDRGRVLRHHAALVVGLRRLVGLHPPRDLIVGEIDVEPARVDVDGDRVAVPDGGDRAAAGRLRGDVARHQTMGRAGEAAVGEQGHLVADALADQRGRDLKHLAHTGAAGGALVADHDHVAGLDALLLDDREALLLRSEDPRRAAVPASLLARDLHHATLRGEVAAEDHQTAGGLERIRERPDDLLAYGLLGSVGLLADRLAGHRDRLPVEDAGLV